MCCLRWEFEPPKICDSNVTARRSVARSDFVTGTTAVSSLADRGRESRIPIKRSQEAADAAGDAIVAVLARRSTTMLVGTATEGGNRKGAPAPTECCEDCRLLPQVLASLLSKSRALRFFNCQVWV